MISSVQWSKYPRSLRPSSSVARFQGPGVYNALRCVCGGDMSMCVHLKPDKGMSKISILQGNRFQVGPKEWPPCPWSPACLSACSLKISVALWSCSWGLEGKISVYIMDKEEDRGEDKQYGGGDCRVLAAETWDLCKQTHGRGSMLLG